MYHQSVACFLLATGKNLADRLGGKVGDQERRGVVGPGDSRHLRRDQSEFCKAKAIRQANA